MPPLRVVRRLKGFSQAALAIATGLAPSTISHIETGKTEAPHPATIRRLARVLDIDPATVTEFVEREDER